MSAEWPDDEMFRALTRDPSHGASACDVWKALAAMHRAGPDAVRAWVADRAEWLPEAVLGIGILGSQAEEFASGSDRDLELDEMCGIRSGLELLRHGYLMAGLDDPADELGLDRWDDVLEVLGKPSSTRPRITPPPGTPPDHWWWRAQTEGRPAINDDPDSD